MIEVLYCFDENYNTQGFSSIYSLLNKSSIKLNINIIHKSISDVNLLPKQILNHKNLNNINVYKFINKGYDFPNINGSHVSEATYYRLFIEDYLPNSIQQFVYMDADIVCVNDPSPDIEIEVNKLKTSDKVISCKTELYFNENNEAFNRLKMNSNEYFNAGLMVIDLKKWRDQRIKLGILDLLQEEYNNLKYWDQDLLNCFFDGKYIKLDEKFNKVIDLAAYEYTNFSISNKDFKKNAIFVHYAGSHKPWNINGILCNLSEIYQQNFRDLFGSKYHITHKMKRLSIYYLIRSFINFSFFKSKYPVWLLYCFVQSLFSNKKYNFN